MSKGLRKAICYRAMQSGNGNLQYFHSGNGNTNKVRRYDESSVFCSVFSKETFRKEHLQSKK